MNKYNTYKAIGITLFITILYGYLYSLLEEDFEFKDPYIDPYYFSLTTMATIGYGDISPKTRRAKLLVMSQQVLIIAMIVNVSDILTLFRASK